MRKRIRTYALHILLFLLSLFTTMLVGAELLTAKMWLWGLELPPEVDRADVALNWSDLWTGLPYAIAFLTFLTFHEFGHYFTALYHKVKCSLPYYIPIYIPFMLLNIGSFGAVIRLRQVPESTRKYFDIGIAGPLAGFAVSLFLIIYGLATLPPLEEHVLEIHPEYAETFGGVPTAEEMTQWIKEQETETVTAFIGTNLLFELCKQIVPCDPTQVPSGFELMHYPFLFAGFITLFFTALNLLPIGQLDGGHIIYGMFGKRIAGLVARGATLALILVGGIGFVNFEVLSGEMETVLIEVVYILLYIAFLLYVLQRIFKDQSMQIIIPILFSTFVAQILIKNFFPDQLPNYLWFIYAFLTARVIGVDHPPAYFEHKVNRPRQILGWIAILIFVLCFTFEPIKVVGM